MEEELSEGLAAVTVGSPQDVEMEEEEGTSVHENMEDERTSVHDNLSIEASEDEEKKEYDTFGNGGFEQVVSKKKAKPPTDNVNMSDTHGPRTGKRYVICQVQEKRLILCLPNPNAERGGYWPLFLALTDDVAVNSERPLLLSDHIWVTEFRWDQNFKFLTPTNWLHQGMINPQGHVTSVNQVRLVAWKREVGFVSEVKTRGKGGIGSACVIAYGMVGASALYSRQCDRGLTLNWLKVGDLVSLDLADIEGGGWKVGLSYILPPKCDFGRGIELPIFSGQKVLARESQFRTEWPRMHPLSKIPIIYPILPSFTSDQVRLAEKVMAAALALAAGKDEATRLETTYRGHVSSHGFGQEQHFSIRFERTDKKDIKKILDMWSLDSTVTVSLDDQSRAFAQGYVKGIRKLPPSRPGDPIKVEIQLILVSHLDTDHQVQAFDSMRHGERVVINVPSTEGNFRQQSMTFGDHHPSLIMEKDSPRAAILRALFARPGTDLLAGGSGGEKIDLGQINLECVRELNTEQRETLAKALDSVGVGKLVFQQAPPGTGKTKSAAAFIASTVQGNVKPALLASATANLPVAKLVEEMEKTKVNPERVAFFSGTAKVKYGDQIAQIGDHMLIHHVKAEAFKKLVSGKELEELAKYEVSFGAHPRRTQEVKVGDLLLKKQPKQVVFGTVHMILEMKEALRRATHLVLDETTQISFTTLAHLICRMPNLEVVLATGDKRQLGVHLQQFDDVLHTGFGLESVVEQFEMAPDVIKTALIRCYRAHPAIVSSFAYASYEKHGESVEPAVTADQRTGLTGLGINLPHPEVPIVLLHIPGGVEQDPTSFSIACPEQTRAAVRMIQILEECAEAQHVVAICLYTYQAERLKEALAQEKSEVQVCTVDSFQAQERKLVVLVTTRTKAALAGPREMVTSDFIKDERRATVALSRAQHGLFVIADFEAIKAGEVWDRFIQFSAKMTPVVDDRYFDVVTDANATRGFGQLLNDADGRPLVADTRLRGGGPMRSGERSRETSPARQPARGQRNQECYNCGRRGHISRNCRSRRKN